MVFTLLASLLPTYANPLGTYDVTGTGRFSDGAAWDAELSNFSQSQFWGSSELDGVQGFSYPCPSPSCGTITLTTLTTSKIVASFSLTLPRIHATGPSTVLANGMINLTF